MKRTTVMLPEDLKLRAMKKAGQDGMSLGELIRQSLAGVLRDRRAGFAGDPFLSDERVYAGKVPKNLSKEHDRYLYGEPG